VELSEPEVVFVPVDDELLVRAFRKDESDTAVGVLGDALLSDSRFFFFCLAMMELCLCVCL